MILRYPGGKAKAAGFLKSLLPFDYSEYREPFCGSAALFALIDPCKKRWINDCNKRVIGLYRELRKSPRLINRTVKLLSGLHTADDYQNEFNLSKLKLADDDPLAYMVTLQPSAMLLPRKM